jgi:hypothetical protein
VRVGGGGRGSVGHGHGRRGVWVEDELFNSDNLLAVAELLQLAEKRLDLVNERFTLCLLELTEDLFFRGVSIGCAKGGRYLRIT